MMSEPVQEEPDFEVSPGKFVMPNERKNGPTPYQRFKQMKQRKQFSSVGQRVMADNNPPPLREKPMVTRALKQPTPVTFNRDHQRNFTEEESEHNTPKPLKQ